MKALERRVRHTLRPSHRQDGHGKPQATPPATSASVPAASVPAASVPVTPVPEMVPLLENQVTELEGKLVSETARADGAVQELKDIKEYSGRIKSLKSAGKKMARATAGEYLDECGHHEAAELVSPSTSTDTVMVTVAFPRNVAESKVVIKSALKHSTEIRVSLEDEYDSAAIELKKVIKQCRANKLKLAENLINSGKLCFSQLQIEEKLLADRPELQTGQQISVEQLLQVFPHLAVIDQHEMAEEKALADQPLPQMQEQPLVERLVQTVSQLVLVEQSEPMTTDGQSSSEYLEPHEPNPAMLFSSAAAGHPLPAFLAQPGIQEHAPVRGDTLVQDDASAIRIRVAG